MSEMSETEKPKKRLSELLDWRKKEYPNDRARCVEQLLKYACHPSDRIDPLKSSGGSQAFIKSILQGLYDLDDYFAKVCNKIAEVNAALEVEIEGSKRTVLEWNRYRDNVLPHQIDMYKTMLQTVANQRLQNHGLPRSHTMKRGTEVAAAPIDLVVCFDEIGIQKKLDELHKLRAAIPTALNVLNTNTFIDI